MRFGSFRRKGERLRDDRLSLELESTEEQSEICRWDEKDDGEGRSVEEESRRSTIEEAFQDAKEAVPKTK